MATAVSIDEFIALHERYLRADARLLELQNAALMKMREIGVGCTSKEAKAEFASLKAELEDVLARMKVICDRMV